MKVIIYTSHSLRQGAMSSLIILKLKILIAVFPDYMENNKLKKCDSSFA